MPILAALCAVVLILFVLWDVFEVIILPRRVTRPLRLTTLIYRISWIPWSALARRIRSVQRRETFLSFYGPLSLLLLLAVWIVDLILGFALLQWAFGSALLAQGQTPNFGTELYMSGTTFITLGLGDVVPNSGVARFLTVIEAATGFGLLAIVIGYFPVLYQAFSQREVNITLLDARAGSPPCAMEMLRRYGQEQNVEALNQFLRDWERWAAELLESHLSYPALAFFRSQHDNQSWLAALTVVLDVCTLVLVGIDDVPTKQAKLTFAMARHAAVDLSQVLQTKVEPHMPETKRISHADKVRIREILKDAGMTLSQGDAADKQIAQLFYMYEPYVTKMSEYLLMPLPPWIPDEGIQDDWLTSA